MNETEIRKRLRDAVGDADYPPGLAGKVVARLAEPPSPAHPRLIGVIAAVLAVLIVVSLVYVRMHSTQSTRPATNPSPAATATPQVVLPPQHTLPDADLAAAQLTAAAGVVTPFHEVSTGGGRTGTLIGGYADPARIALVFRTLPDAGSPHLQVSDDHGPSTRGSLRAPRRRSPQQPPPAPTAEGPGPPLPHRINCGSTAAGVTTRQTSRFRRRRPSGTTVSLGRGNRSLPSVSQRRMSHSTSVVP